MKDKRGMKTKRTMKYKRTLKEDMSMVVRGFRILCEMNPGDMLWFTLRCTVGRLPQYVTLYMSALLIDEIVAGAGFKRLLIIALTTLGVQFVLNVLEHFLRRKEQETNGILYNLQELYLLKVQCRMQYKYFDDPETAQLRNQIRNHSNYGGHGLMRLRWTYASVLDAVLNLILSVSLTVSMFRILEDVALMGFLKFINSHYSMVLLLLVIGIQVAVQLLTIRRYEPEVAKIFGDGNKRFTRAIWYMQWKADGKVFRSEALSLNRIRGILVENEYLKEVEKLYTKINVTACVGATLMNIILFLYVGAKAYIGVFGIGSFILYRGTVEKFSGAVAELGSQIGRLRENNDYMEELFRFLDLPDEMYKGSLAVEKRDDYRYEIEFRNVSFQYPGSDKYALRNVSFKFRIGERLAFVGMNGSGKTTFVKLLTRLYDPTEGQILLNGIDITRYKYDEYMALFSVVFQDYFMFAFNLGENVSGKMDYDADRVKRCLEKAGFGNRLAELERGLETPIGREYQKDGVDMSGGEEQKIALARALYKDAPFIILDEPTAALDPLAEAEVYSTFNEIVEERTAIYISHRLSSCRFCDNIVVFHEGEVVQYGNHEKLMADESGKYRELWNAQAKYYA